MGERELQTVWNISVENYLIEVMQTGAEVIEKMKVRKS